MSLFHKTREVVSTHNGVISLLGRVGHTEEIFVQGYDQTSAYTDRMWSQALKRLPASLAIKRVLVLGLGGGGIIPYLFRRFPPCRITAVDWDTIMIQIGKQRLSYKERGKVSILQGDAGEIVRSLTDTFDLIIIDLFTGPTVSPLLASPEFLQSLVRLLDRQGFLLFNAFHEKSYFAHIATQLSFVSSWRFRYNTLGLFRPRGSGTTGDLLPEGYVNYRCCAEYMRREVSHGKIRIVGEGDAAGFRSEFGPFAVERYISDSEPSTEKDSHRKLVVWRTVVRTDHPKGWIRSRAIGGIGLTGFVDRAEAGEKYWSTWSSHAQRHRKKWREQTSWKAETVSPAEFIASYKTIRKDPSLKALFIILLKKKIRAHGDRVHLIGLRNASTGRLGGGFAWLDIPEVSQSLHVISFIHPPAKRDSGGVGLMDEWFVYAKASNIRFLDFGLYWSSGEPKSWKHFSNFKAQFGIRYLMFPPPMMKFVGKA